MHCPACQHENPSGAKFCLECGRRLSLRCAACGTDLPGGAKFCLECGSPTPGEEAGEQPDDPRAYRPKHLAETHVAARSVLPDSFASGRYRVERFLGEGAKKRVYLARDTRLDRAVAISVIKSEGLDAEARLRIRREAQAMGKLGDHPNVVTIHDILEEDGQIYLVAEHMAGGDLDRRLREAEHGRLPVPEALRIARDLCHGLEHAHSRGVVHRDLKPGNIWMSGDGRALIGDFGLALSLDRTRLTQDRMMVGTATYMPPEQALSGQVTSRSDLYALGVVLYEMLTGRPPFMGDDAVAVISQHVNTAPVAPSWHNSQVPKPLEGLVLALLAKNPEQRPSTAGEVLRELETCEGVGSEVAEPGERAEANPLDRLAEGIFVGRDRELLRLKDGLDAALSGRGRILLLVGEPGIGKTRTTEELSVYAGMRGAKALWGRCYEGEGAPAYWPWVQIVRAYVHDREPKELLSYMGPGAADIAEVVSEVRERLPGLPKPPELDPEEARFRLFDSVSTFIRNASRADPLVLVLDDLHWADKASLLLFQFLARDLANSRILLLGTYRDVELGRQHPLEQTLAELARNQISERVLLRGLSEQDVERFIELTSGRTPPAALVEAVYRETEGNPFFVQEVVQLLQSDGRLERPEGVASWSLEIPQGVRQVLGLRLNSLSQEGNRVLATASVIGREFELRVLARVAELDEDALLERLEEAEDARIIGEVEGSAGTYRFSHALIRETLYDEIRTTRRLRLHRGVGEVLEELYASKLEPRLAELAYHFCEAASGGDVDKAVDYAVRAAQRERDLLAYEEEANQYDRALTALEAAETIDASRQCDLLLSLGEAHRRAGAGPQCRASFQRAMELARELDSAERFASAALGFSPRPSASFADPILVTLFEEALERLEDVDSGLRARVMARLGAELVWSRGERGRSLVDEAMAMARRLGDRHSRVWIAPLYDFAVGRGVGPEGRLELADEALKGALETGSKSDEFSARVGRALGLIDLARADEIDGEIEAIDRLSQELRISTLTGSARLLRATRALWQGNLEEARGLAWEFRKVALRFAPEAATQTFGVQVYLQRRFQGRLAETIPTLRAGVERYETARVWGCLLTCAYAESGQPGEARAEFERLAEDSFARELADTSSLVNLALLADCCSILGDAKRASVLYEAGAQEGARYVRLASMGTFGSIARSLGQLATTMGRFEGAEAHFEEALEVETKMRARGWLPRAQCDYARMLLQRDKPGDHDEALALLQEALDASRALGLKGWLDMCLDLKLRAQGAESSSVQTSIHRVAASFGARRPNMGTHSAPDGTVTLMFSDMEGFTEMTERLGDIAAREVIRKHNAIVREQLLGHGGHEVELQGDGFLLAFGSARQALLCAVGIQRAFAAHNLDAEETIRVRIGLHTGEALKDADKFFGKTVILAARIAGQANGGEILVSSLLRDLTQSAGDFRFGNSRDVELKGLSERQRVFSVDWT